MKRVEKLLSFPYYSKRQFIYIVNDYNQIKQTNGKNILENTVDVAFDSVKETVKDTFVPSRIISNVKEKKWLNLLPNRYLKLGVNTAEAIKARRIQSDMEDYANWEAAKVKPILEDEAINLKFPVGHPKEKVVYVAHPTVKDRYFPFASFHRLTFEHKCAEAIRLLMHLGATEIEVIHKNGWDKQFASQLDFNVPVEGIPVDSEMGVESGNRSRSELLFKLSLDGNTNKPEIPDDLVWYPHEESWKQIAEGRMKFNLSEFSLEMNYKDDYEVNANLKVKIQEYGLDLGGSFEEHQSTTWVLKGRFN